MSIALARKMMGESDSEDDDCFFVDSQGKRIGGPAKEEEIMIASSVGDLYVEQVRASQTSTPAVPQPTKPAHAPVRDTPVSYPESSLPKRKEQSSQTELYEAPAPVVAQGGSTQRNTSIPKSTSVGNYASTNREQDSSKRRQVAPSLPALATNTPSAISPRSAAERPIQERIADQEPKSAGVKGSTDSFRRYNSKDVNSGVSSHVSFATAPSKGQGSQDSIQQSRAPPQSLKSQESIESHVPEARGTPASSNSRSTSGSRDLSRAKSASNNWIDRDLNNSEKKRLETLIETQPVVQERKARTHYGHSGSSQLLSSMMERESYLVKERPADITESDHFNLGLFGSGGNSFVLSSWLQSAPATTPRTSSVLEGALASTAVLSFIAKFKGMDTHLIEKQERILEHFDLWTVEDLRNLSPSDWDHLGLDQNIMPLLQQAIEL